MVFKIKLLHESTGLYTCDCYYISTATKDITIESGKMSGSLELSHTLDNFLTENGYTFNSSYMNLVSFNSKTSGFNSNHLCSLGRNHVTLWCTSPTPVSSNINITFRLYKGLLCSAILENKKGS